MPQIHLETFIAAPAEVCFDLCLNVNAHEQAGHGRAVAGITAGQLQLGDTVTWEAVHFLVRQRLTSRIVAYERPHMFVDEMQRGAFKHWRHTHRFIPRPDGTLMIDDVEFAAPCGILGMLAESLLLKRYMTRFLVQHNLFFKRMAEAKAGHTQPLQPSPSNAHTTELAREA